MAKFLKCFKKNKMEGNNQSLNSCELEKLLECPNCKTVLKGFWENNSEQVTSDGGIRICCRATKDSDSSSDGNSPTRVVNGNANSAFFVNDYGSSARPDAPGISHMPVSKNSPNYNMNHRRRGKALIFNFDEWKNTNLRTLDLSPRAGSKKDRKDLKECLKSLSFEVQTYDNLRRQDYDRVIEQVRLEDHSDADCLVIAIMTHGEKNSIYLNDGSLIPVNSVWEEFEANVCPTLAGKPKIFIIQACRGGRYDHGTRLMSGGGRALEGQQNDVIDSGSFSYVIPNAADIIVAFSCPLGHYSWRSPEKGSWFIQSICKVFNNFAYEMELQSLLTTVAREVAMNFESSTTEYKSDRKKQVPSTSSTLIRNVIFHHKPFVRYQQPQTPVGNTIESATQTPGNVQPITSHDVHLAVAAALSTVTLDEDISLQTPAKRPNVLPLMTLIDGEDDVTEEKSQMIEQTTSVLPLEETSSDPTSVDDETANSEASLLK